MNMSNLFNPFMRYNLQFFADGEAGGTGSTTEGGSTAQTGAKKTEEDKTSSAGESGSTAKSGGDKTYTQAEVDKIVKDRLARQQKKMQTAMGDDPATQGTEGATPGVDPAAQQAAQQAQAQLVLANQRLIQAAGMSEALKLGVDPKYTSDVITLAMPELSKIEVKEDGTMDTAAVSKAIDGVLKRVPIFKTTTQTAGGFKVGGDGQQQPPSNNGWNANSQQSQSTKPWNRVNRV
jgi:hypothetical protein